MSLGPEPRFSYERVWKLAGCPTNAELARRTDINLRNWQRWKRAGVSKRYADRVAARLGMHPGEVWGWDEWFAA